MSAEWKHGICDCCSAGAGACIICCLGCPCVNWGSAMNVMDPNKSCFVEGFKSILCCFCCPMFQRGEMREHYGIAGSPANDWICCFCCYSCVGIQMLAEAQARK